ncbi:MAG: CehA/McbA family metallohydrolase, partial [Planctomycetota bacterium]|nr:CehA/McbA family metallohydrolase [Planctomycetota bacterium]
MIEIQTLLTRTKHTGVLKDFEMGDAVQWGGTEHFAPGLGFDLPERTVTQWLAGVGPGVSYGYVGQTDDLDARHGRSWSDPIVKTADLTPGQTLSYTRYLIVGTGDTASIVKEISASQGPSVRMVAGRVVAEEGERPVPGARVGVFGDAPHPLFFALADDRGRFELPIPLGRVEARASAPGRKVTGRVAITEDLVFRLGPEGRIVISLTGEDGKPLPGRMTIEGLGETLDPNLGPTSRAAGARNIIATITGRAEAHIPPGRYRITASRGPEYTIHQREIEVEGGKPLNIDFRIRKAIDTTGYFACDFHQHAANSADSGVSLEDRVIANVAEGLELMVSSDHDFLTDFAPTIRRLGLEKLIRSMVGDEVTTASLGHFNAYPLRPDPGSPRDGALDPWEKTPAEIFSSLRASAPVEKVIQINHPRSPKNGYFAIHSMDAARGSVEREGFSWDFDAIEVWNGLRTKEAESVLQDWFGLLNRGRRYLATGNSDTHDVFWDRSGYPRNYVWVEGDDPASISPDRIVRALKIDRSVVVTNGPFLTMEGPGGARIGSVVHYPEGDVPIRVRIQTAPWIEVNRLQVVANGRVVHDLEPEGDEIDLAVPLEGDGWIVVIVRGDRTMEPVLAATPFAFTNPIWIDRAGDGFDPPSRSR